MCSLSTLRRAGRSYCRGENGPRSRFGQTAEGPAAVDRQACGSPPGLEVLCSHVYAAVYNTCAACGNADDILGRYGYCSCCGARNDLQELTQTIETIQQKTRERLTAKERLEAAVPDAVSAFDSTARQYAKQLARRVPMIPARRTPLEGALYHQVAARAEELKSWFDIDLFRGLDPDDVAFVRRMFARRHVYEHNGGEVDARYLEESGDATVKVKQRRREDPESVFRLTGLVLKMAKNLHEGFHALFPPEAMPIRLHEEQQARLEAYRRQHTQPGPPTA